MEFALVSQCDLGGPNLFGNENIGARANSIAHVAFNSELALLVALWVDWISYI